MPVTLAKISKPQEKELEKLVRQTVARRVKTSLAAIRGRWPQVGDGPHADGSPSQATNTSRDALEMIQKVGPGTHNVTLQVADKGNPRTGQPASKYHKYVHHTGGSAGPPGDALKRAKSGFLSFKREVGEDLNKEIWPWLKRNLSR